MAAYTLVLERKGITYNGSDSKGDLGLTVNNPITVKYQEQWEMNLSLYGVSFHRKMYEPSHIQAEILIELNLKEETANKAPAPPPLDTLTAMLMHRPVTLKVDGATVAENFYIHEIAPQYYCSSRKYHLVKDDDGETDEANSYYYYIYSIYTKLDIFSLDKMFTLNKYSRAYLGKRLFADIIKDQLSDMPAVFSYTASGSNGTDSLTLGMAKADERVLQHLSYKVSGVTYEMICPYLVQYNESPYDFITRLANRFGEPLYFEDGVLCYGLKKLGTSETPFSIDNAQSVVFQRISQPACKVGDYARDDTKEWGEKTFKDSKGVEYKKSTYEPDQGKFLSDDVEFESGGYPSDAFALLDDKALAEGHYPYFYNMEYSADDQYQLLYKDKISRVDEKNYKWWGGEGLSAFFPVLSDILNSTSLLGLLSKFLSKMATQGIQASIRGKQRQDYWNSIYKKYRLNDNDDYAVLFADLDNDRGHWCTFNYYWDIKQKADELQRRMVCVEMGPNNVLVNLGTDKKKKVGIGDRITLPYDTNVYIVVQIDMCNSTPFTKKYYGFDDETLLKPGTQQQRIYAIPLGSDSLFYPPLLTDKPFPKSGPQPAFVVDNKDPLFQGRVRVSFTWQPSYTAMQKAVKDYQDTIDNWDKDREAAYNYLKKYSSSISTVNGRVTACSKASSASDADFNNAKNQYDAVVAKYDAANAAISLAKKRLDTYKDIDSNTPWIRVATPMATPGGGMFFRPEVGDEVMVDFENGNMERPYVVGCLYSKNKTQPWQGERVIVSKNGHTIRFTDPNNPEVLGAGLYPGMKYLASIGAIGKQLPKFQEEPLPCVGGIELTDSWGLYDIRMSSHDRNITISSPFGDVRMNALTGISISAPNGNIKISGKNVEIHAANRFSVTSGENIKNGGYFAGFSKAGLGKALGQVVTGVTGLDKWLDFSILRTLLEIVIRPVDGTLELKSYRYLLMEAGGGEAYIKPSFYKKEGYDQTARTLAFTELKQFFELFMLIGPKVDAFVQDFIKKYNAAVDALAAFTDDDDIAPGGNPANGKIRVPANKNTLVNDLAAKTKVSQVLDYVYGMTFTGGVTAEYVETVYTRCLTLYNAIKAVKNHAANRNNILNDLYTPIYHSFWYKNFGTLWGASGAQPLSFSILMEICRDYDFGTSLGTDISGLDTDHFAASKLDNAYDAASQIIKRKIAYKIITNSSTLGFKSIEVKNEPSVDDTPVPDNPYANDRDWGLFLSSIRFDRRNDFVNALFASTLGSMMADNPANVEKNIWSYEGDIWDQSAVGEILFANKDAKTYHFIPDRSNVEGYESPENGKDIVAYYNKFRRLITY